MKKVEKDKQGKITKISIDSRRSSPVGKEYFTYNVMIESDVSDLTDEEINKEFTRLWDRANNQIDSQLESVVNGI